MAEAIRTHDWSSTALGPPEQWPATLKVAVDICLGWQEAAFVCWGPELIQIHNDAFACLFGDAHLDYLGHSAADIWAQSAAVRALFDQVLHDGMTRQSAVMQLGLEQTRSRRLSCSPLRNAAGELSGLFVRFEQVEGKAPQEPAESEARFRALADLSPDALIVNVEGRIRYVNAAAVRLLGADTPQRLIGVPALNFIHPDYHDLARDRLANLWPRNNPVNPLVEQCWLKFDGQPISVEVAVGTTEWDGKAATQVLIRDISQRKRAAEALRASEARYRALFESMDEAFCILHVVFDEYGQGVDARILEANPAFNRMTGCEFTFGKTLAQLAPDLHRMDIYDRVIRAREPERFEIHEHRLRRWFDTYAFPIGRPERHKVAVIFNDITEQTQAQEELRISNERLELAILGSGDGVWDWDLSSDAIVLTPRFLELLGGDGDGGLRTVAEWEQQVHPADLPGFREAVQACLQDSGGSFMHEYRMRDRNGDWRWLLLRGLVVARSDDGQPLRMTGMISDISARKQADERIWYHANFDPLTSLPNRRMFRDRLEREVRNAARTSQQMGLLFVDLDRFKQVNDLLGHDAGDQLLMQAAQRVSSLVRESDTVARLGGDEFTVILTHLSPPQHVEQVSQKILDALALPFHLGKEVVYISGSVGIALYPDDGISSEELIRKADQAMYAAKGAGKNQFSYFTRSMDEQAHLRLTLTHELRGALAGGQLGVVYQPVIDLNRGGIVKAEALLRWNHPQLGDIEPSTFIPLAEESGMINEIGDWVFRMAADCSKRWSQRLGRPFQIGVNKSPVQFLNAAREQDWLSHLEQIGLPKGNISIEITEGLLLHGSPSVTDKLLEYRGAGVQVAIDDFGTGYSSMAYLKKFEIDYLKIDQSFIRDMERDAGHRTIAESIIVMAHKLGLRVIAEGIETDGQKDILASAGCDYGQGFLFSPPLPAAEFERMLERAEG